MAKQAGILPLIGTLGGVNFYYRKGVPTARKAGGGFNRDAIKHSPNMKRVREQNTEFANCSHVNKHFKLALKPLLFDYKDGTLHYRLMQLFIKIRDCDTVSDHGKRRVHLGMETDLGKRLLLDFNFTPKRADLFPCQYAFDWDSLSLNTRSFNVQHIKFPEQADFMQVCLGVVRFDFESMTYSSLETNTLKITRDFADSSFKLECLGMPKGIGTILVVARTSFYQTVGDQDYILAGGDGMGIAVVGIGES
ncbi:hypothetical protein C1T31_09840 [Hanstruepera neustonica]|uniref:Uncharacterized protein n=1 Tax=Hanstruepera neustonica TaxID=1445657 RepID=A0A2K1DXN6_9FLAO|nr:hypothetical protein [Hanstruepera neustonica]PNQ72802.1 hypothetical protein C1T31_09840 [Hanstruepera neustonica]